jgi:hypothetical protein
MVVLGCWWCRCRVSLSSAGGGVTGGRRLLLRGGRQAEVMEGGSSSLVRGKTFGVKREKEWVCTYAGLQLGENGVQNFFSFEFCLQLGEKSENNGVQKFFFSFEFLSTNVNLLRISITSASHLSPDISLQHETEK